MVEIQDKCSKIDEAYKQKEEDLKQHFAALEAQLSVSDQKTQQQD